MGQGGAYTNVVVWLHGLGDTVSRWQEKGLHVCTLHESVIGCAERGRKAGGALETSLFPRSDGVHTAAITVVC